MAYILRSLFFIGAVYAMSPLRTGDPAVDLSRASLVMAPLAGTVAQASALTGMPTARMTRDAARAFAALDDRTKSELLDLVARTAKAAAADTLSRADRQVP